MDDVYLDRKEAGKYHRTQKYKRGFMTVPLEDLRDAQQQYKAAAPDDPQMMMALCNALDSIEFRRNLQLYKRIGRRTKQTMYQPRQTKKVPRPYRLWLRYWASNAKYLGYKHVVKCKRCTAKRRREYLSGLDEKTFSW